MKRARPLKRDVEKVREFLKRGRENGTIGRSGWQKPVAPPPPGSRPGGLPPKPGLQRRKKSRPIEGPLSPAEWAEQVFELSGGRCIITGARARDAFDRRFHAHHPLPKRELRARRLYGRVWDPRNGVLLRRDVHVRHEDAFERVPHTALPLRVWEFCRELDEFEGSQWATEFVLRAHPVRGARGHSQHEEVRRAEGRERDRPEG